MTFRPLAFRRAAFLSQLGAGIAAVACGTAPAFSASKVELPPATVRPGDALYNAARLDMNGRLDFHPYAIAYCAGPGDVAQAVRWAALNGKTIALRGGGHDYEGFSLNDDGLVIDLSRYSGVTLKKPPETVKLFDKLLATNPKVVRDRHEGVRRDSQRISRKDE